MKKNASGFDRFWYILFCVLTGGLWYLLRVLISEGVRQSIADEIVSNND